MKQRDLVPTKARPKGRVWSEGKPFPMYGECAIRDIRGVSSEDIIALVNKLRADGSLVATALANECYN